MKKIVLLKILIISLLLLSLFCSVTFSFDVKQEFTGEIASDATAAKDSVQDVLVTALTAVRIAGMAIAMIMIIIVGIKIMTAAPSERANVKQYTVNYLIGAFILLGASGILKIVQDLSKSAFGD